MDPVDLFGAEDTPSTRTARIRLLPLLLFCCGFLLVSFGLSRLLEAVSKPETYIEVISDKFAHLRQHADDYAVLFVGTSHVYRCVNPAVVDEVFREADTSARALNLAVPSLTVLEVEALFEEIESLRPARLQVVVIEPNFQPLRMANWSTDRAMRQHDWRSTSFGIGFALHPSATEPKTLLASADEARVHLMSFLGRSASFGRLDRLLLPGTREYCVPAFASPDFDRGGFLPLDEEPDIQFANRRKRFESRRDWAAQLMASSADQINWNRGRLSDLRVAHLRDLIDRVRSLGARPVLLVGPSFKFNLEMSAFLARQASDFADVPVLNYIRGFGFEDVYEVDFWFDAGHLNTRGADVFSHRLGQDLLPLLGEAKGD